MEVSFRGGPLDRQTLEVPDKELHDRGAIYWPSSADLGVHHDTVPGDDDVVEYRYVGGGVAEYVGGILHERP